MALLYPPKEQKLVTAIEGSHPGLTVIRGRCESLAREEGRPEVLSRQNKIKQGTNRRSGEGAGGRGEGRRACYM